MAGRHSIALMLVFFLIPNPSLADARTEVDGYRAAFLQIINEKSGLGVEEFLSQNVEVFPPNTQGITGIDLVSEYFKNLKSIGVLNLKLQSNWDLDQASHYYELGEYLMLANAEEGVIEVNGNYHILWIKEKSKWRILRFIWTIHPFDE